MSLKQEAVAYARSVSAGVAGRLRQRLDVWRSAERRGEVVPLVPAERPSTGASPLGAAGRREPATVAAVATETKAARIVALFDAGLSDLAIAERVGCRREYVRCARLRAGKRRR